MISSSAALSQSAGTFLISPPPSTWGHSSSSQAANCFWKDVISVAAAGRLLGMSTHSAYRAVRSGAIPSIKVGGRWILRRDVLEEWARKQALRRAVAHQLALLEARTDLAETEQ